MSDFLNIILNSGIVPSEWTKRHHKTNMREEKKWGHKQCQQLQGDQPPTLYWDAVYINIEFRAIPQPDI